MFKVLLLLMLFLYIFDSTYNYQRNSVAIFFDTFPFDAMPDPCIVNKESKIQIYTISYPLQIFIDLKFKNFYIIWV